MSQKVIAYSYIRYSFRKQEEGDSVRRQTDRAAAYCARHGWRLDDSLKADRAVSAFRGKNALVGNLASFLKDIEAGRVRPGSVLVVESIDRLSRQGVREGWDLCRRILEGGVRIVTLSPERLYDEEATKGLMKGMLELLIILERAAEESQTKSDRISEGWAARRRAGRAARAAWHRIWPAWFRKEGERFVVDDEAVKSMRRLFALATEGFGAGSIARKLDAEGLPPIGRRPMWVRGTVAKYLNDRRVLGEFQPMTGTPPAPDGTAVPDYFPRIISDQEFYAAMAARKDRGVRGKGRPAKAGEVNIFKGIARDARDRSSLLLRSEPVWGQEGERYHVLVNSRGQNQHVGRVVTFPYLLFEEMVLSKLAEVDFAEIAGGQSEADYLAGLEGELAELRGRVEALEAELLAGQVGAVVKVLRQLEARERELNEEIEKTKGSRARPLQAGWDAFRGLLAQQSSISGRVELKTRLAAALARIVDEMLVLVVGKSLTRRAAVQVFFRDGRSRLYLLFARRYNNAFGKVSPARHAVRSWPVSADEATINLRDADHVAKIEAALREMDLVDEE